MGIAGYDAEGKGKIEFDEFFENNSRFPSLLFPAFRVQESMMKGVIGRQWWRRKRDLFNRARDRLRHTREANDAKIRRAREEAEADEILKKRALLLGAAGVKRDGGAFSGLVQFGKRLLFGKKKKKAEVIHFNIGDVVQARMKTWKTMYVERTSRLLLLFKGFIYGEDDVR